MSTIIVLVGLLLGSLFSSSTAFAHSRWFLGSSQLPPAPPVVFDPIYAAMIIAVLMFVAGGVLLEQASKSRANLAWLLHDKFNASGHLAWRILAVAFGAVLVINSLQHVLVAPDIVLGQGFLFHVVAFSQIVIGSMFILQSRLHIAGIMVFLLPFGCWGLYSFGHAIDYTFELFGIGAALFIMAPIISSVDREQRASVLRQCPLNMRFYLETPARSFQFRWHNDVAPSGAGLGVAASEQRERGAVSILRLMFGLQLIVLAAHDKLLFPEISLAFVEKFSFVNFPALLGASSFTNLHFVIGAGLAEVAFGVMLMGRVAVRPVCAILLLIFIVTGFVFGVDELVGHVPIVATLLVLFVSGSARSAASVSQVYLIPAAFKIASGASAALVLGSFLQNAPAPANSTRAINAASVAEVLYSRFLRTNPGQFSARRELARANESVHGAIAAAQSGRDIDKDDLSRRLFELSVRYESEFGADGASLWLRYAHLTATCSHDDLVAFRALVTSATWQEMLQRAPAALVAELRPVALRSAEAIMKRRINPADAAEWQAVAAAAPASGAHFVHTHTLASISRIVAIAATETEVWGRLPVKAAANATSLQ